MKTDVFLCYRRYSAQTAKLFKRYLLKHHFNGEVWYSDSEAYGNYKLDPPSLIGEAECAIILIDPNFTFNFLGNEDAKDCITAIEIVEILKKKLIDDTFRITPVLIDRQNTLSAEESEIICTLLRNEGIPNPEDAVKLISQSNALRFSTAYDDEDELFAAISFHMLPDEFYKSHRPKGNFYFGVIPTTVDIIIWDSLNYIDPHNILFLNTPVTFSLYRKIEKTKVDLDYEEQNNKVISLVGTDTILNDETEEKILSIRFQAIDYRLFYKTLQMWEQFELNRKLADFDWRSDLYQIPNGMGLAFMVLTSDQKMLFTRRSKKRKVRSEEYDCSIVEGLKKSGKSKEDQSYDINDENYLMHEMKRAFREEICAEDENLVIRIYGLALDKSYGQWNLVGTISTSLSSDEILRKHPMRDDTYEDNQMLFVPYTDEKGNLSLSELESQLRLYRGDRLWDMALTPLYAALLQVGFTSQQIDSMTQNI